MHKLLLRQLKRNFPVKEVADELKPLLQAISEAYDDFDNEKHLLERSLELVSDELNERNRELKRRLQQLEHTYEQLGESMSVLDGIFDATGEAIFAFDQKGRLIRFNQTAQDTLNLASGATIYGNNRVVYQFSKLLREPAAFFHELKRLKSSPKANLFGVVELKDKRLYEYHSTPQLSNDELVGRVWCFRNVTQIKENEALVQYQAFHDTLTGLPNRVLLLDRINHATALSQRNRELLAVLFVDLDYFKKVNDTEGHQVGDELLIDVAKRIKGCLRDHDTLARFGGDEFVVLLESIKSHQIASHTSQRIIEQLKKPFEIFGKQFHISASIGVSIYPRDDTDPQELIRKADMAMYHAKQQGRSNFEFFDSPLERLAHYQLELENKLRNALHQKELTVYYQPQVYTTDFSVHRMEALLRWFPDNESAVSPADFVPVAERAGMICEIGLWVLEEVCQKIQSWRKKSTRPFRVSVNLSAHQIADINLLDQIRMIMARFEIPGRYLEFEITESILLEDLEKTKTLLIQLRELDISLAIDDFGTGYSSLQYLQKLPIDLIKIDRLFIRDLMEDTNKQSIVNANISLGHNLNLQVVAEGVEDKKVADYLKARECEFIQGFHFYKPMPPDLLLEVLLKQQ